MKVSSTEFQQRVGYYLSLAEKGIEVLIERKKPGTKLFVLSMKIPKNGGGMSQREEFLRKFRSIPAMFPGGNCVDFQRRVRR